MFFLMARKALCWSRYKILETPRMETLVTQTSRPRTLPMKKPEGHKAVIQRYSSRVDQSVEALRMAVLGYQEAPGAHNGPEAFLAHLAEMFSHTGAPFHHDISMCVDDQGFTNSMAVCYWQDEAQFAAWCERFDQWWAALDPSSLSVGLWIETFSVAPEYRETNLFQEYLRGLSACPMAKIEPMDESGYWGAARDRFAASAHDDFAPDVHSDLQADPYRQTLGKRIIVSDIPSRLCVIRSGVTWANCGDEQLASYESNLKPKLDAGMAFLRANPEETGCCSLRQVTCLDAAGAALQEAYSLGIFLTYGHLEKWAHDHPTHLAIYTRALAERKKYQENLELLTYHEIYVLNENVRCEYLNCQPRTGVLPYFTNRTPDDTAPFLNP